MTNNLFAKSELGQSFKGTVVYFDSHVALGKIKLEDGREVDFHCTNIADGTRDIALNTTVTAELYFHPQGRFELKNINK